MKPQQFQKKLMQWFDQCGRKHLPWQQNKTPYRVWVSEIMLQQTQVNTVIPYFERFMQRFPTVLALANANEDEVLHAWAGLGYYSRARYLHRAAILITNQYHGQFPDQLDSLQTLPGVGESTAAAILSIAFNQPATILDGNVKRVLARLHAMREPINEKQIEDQLWVLAKYYTPTTRSADYTQAIMDLGATLCTRSKPDCSHCPFTKHCLAYQEDAQHEIPKKKKTRALPIRTATFIIMKKGAQVLLFKRPTPGIWGGLWSLPEITGTPDIKSVRAFCKQYLQGISAQYQPLSAFRHTFSHYHLDIFPVLMEIKKAPTKIVVESEQIWYNLQKPKLVGLPKPVQSILRNLA